MLAISPRASATTACRVAPGALSRPAHLHLLRGGGGSGGGGAAFLSRTCAPPPQRDDTMSGRGQQADKGPSRRVPLLLLPRGGAMRVRHARIGVLACARGACVDVQP
jgi:hypothetical protein